MEFSIKASTALARHKTGCLIVPCFADQGLGEQGQQLNTASQGELARLATRDLDTKVGSLLNMPLLPGVSAERVLLLSLGNAADYQSKTWRQALHSLGRSLANSKTAHISLCVLDAIAADSNLPNTLQNLSQILGDACYRFDAPRQEPNTPAKLQHIECLLVARSDNASKVALAEGAAVAKGMALTRTLGNLPANVCTPSYLAETAKTLGKQHKFKVTVFDRAGIEKLGMGSFLSVTLGATEPPRFIVMEYKGGKAKDAPIVLVGKGVTFDTGGISLKPGEGMDEMKYDMCGAASVLGTFQAIAEMGLPLNVIGLIPSTENMPAGNATRPGDVVRSMSGQTIEILNTDAEGRLILCDALTYAERFKPAAVIDIATLTGACIIALGHQVSGLMANDEALAAELLACGQASGDRAWQLPLFDDYQDQLKSNFADMANIGGRPAGSITAGAFLSRFAKAYKWAHLDIAGTAWKSGAEKGATGRPVPLLCHFLRQRASR